MDDDTETLAAILIQADRFCMSVQALIEDSAPDCETEELRLKLNQSRTLLRNLQALYNDDRLSVAEPATRAGLRFLLTSLMWVAFRARRIINFKTFRMLVTVEAAFTAVLTDRWPTDSGST